MDHNFHTLNDREFEGLTGDLLQEHLGLTLERFRPGKDKGIDLRNTSTVEESGLIVQVKHWMRADFRQLLRELKKNELKKIKKLNPQRYIVATSVELNPMQKDEIAEALKPYVLTPGDIFGRDDINNLLRKHSAIAENHPKLGLSNAKMIRKIVNNGIQGRSEFASSSVEKNISLYVANKKYSDSLNILNKEHFLVIIGEPGIGKTVLAKMLMYQLCSKGYKIVAISEKVSEAENLWETGKKQVFYFDDFLGANYLEIAQNRNSDSALVDFIRRVKSDPTKRLILTSRTSVLNQAVAAYPKLETPSIDLARHEVKIADYTKLDKARILYNHLFFLGVKDDYCSKIKEDRNYRKIIDHKNYNPRLIEFITDPLRLQDTDPDEYMTFTKHHLDNPAEIWRHPYQNQTDDYGKFLIQTLFSLGDVAKEDVLRQAFNARLDYEIRNNGFKRESEVFETRLRHLMGGFMKGSRDHTGLKLEFFNPSIVDFLLNFLRNNNDEKWRMLESAVFTSQLYRFLSYSQNSIKFKEEEKPRLVETLLRIEDRLSVIGGGSPEIDLLNFYYFSFPYENIDSNCARLMMKIDFESTTERQAASLLESLNSLSNYDEFSESVKERWRELIDYLFLSATRKTELDSIRKLFDTYDMDYDAYISTNGYGIVKGALKRCWTDEISDIASGIDDGFNSSSSSSAASKYLDELYEDGIAYNKKFGVEKLDAMDSIKDIDAEEVFETSSRLSEAEDYMNDYHKDEYYFERESEKETDMEIDRLFQ